MYSEEFQERFWKKVDKTDSCWIWTGTIDCKDGYGKCTYNRKSLRVHRISLELHLGRSILNELVVAHSPIICHNRLCVNPGHLREATILENSHDRYIDNTFLTGKSHPKPKRFNEEEIKLIRNDMRLGRIIADELGISESFVSMIKSKKKYAWVPD